MARNIAKRGRDKRPPEPSEDIQSLFREEAVQHSLRRLEGEVMLATPLSTKLLAAFFVLVVAAAAVFLATGSYTRRETVPGWVQPDSGLIRAAALQNGVVETVLVSEGDLVKAGDPIAQLRTTNMIEGGPLGALVLRDIAEEAAAAKARLEAVRQEMTIEHDGRTAQRIALMREREEARAQVGIYADRYSLAEGQLSRARELNARGLLPDAKLEETRAATLGAASEASRARTAVLTLERQIQELDNAIARYPSQIANLDAQIEETMAQLAQRSTNAGAQDFHIIPAPVTGQVLALPVERGQTVAAGATIAALAPEGSRLIAELYVPSRATGFVEVGQEVRLMYEAFPHEKFGPGAGRIVRVSRTVLSPQDVAASGVPIEEPVFRVRVELDSDTMLAYGQQIRLQPGMLLRANIILDQRSLVEWLFEPIFAAARGN